MHGGGVRKEVLHALGAQATPDGLPQIPSGLPIRLLAFGDAPSEPSFKATACTKRWKQGLAGASSTSASPAIQVCKNKPAYFAPALHDAIGEPPQVLVAALLGVMWQWTSRR